MKEYDIFGCPYCNDNHIGVEKWGGCRQEKRGAGSSLGRIKSFTRSKIIYNFYEDCKCGAKADDIEKELIRLDRI